MRNRFVTRVAKIYKANQTEPGAHLLRRLLIDSLPRQEKQCFELAAKDLTARQLATRLDCAISHSSAILGRLFNYGLLGRVWNGANVGYVYFQSDKPIYDHVIKESK